MVQGRLDSLSRGFSRGTCVYIRCARSFALEDLLLFRLCLLYSVRVQVRCELVRVGSLDVWLWAFSAR